MCMICVCVRCKRYFPPHPAVKKRIEATKAPPCFPRPDSCNHTNALMQLSHACSPSRNHRRNNVQKKLFGDFLSPFNMTK